MVLRCHEEAPIGGAGYDAARRPGDPPILVSDSSKARELLGWVPRFPQLDDQIAHAWAWFRDKMPNV